MKIVYAILFYICTVLTPLYTCGEESALIPPVGKVYLQWKFLVHRQTSKLGGWTGPISDDSAFYIEKSKDKDPLLELSASVLAAGSDPNFPCRFPARARFLRRYYGLRIDESNCLSLQAWREKLQSSRVAVVFATQFVGSPASSMGHTFLNFWDQNKEHYLSQTVNFAAKMPSNVNIAEYVIGGLGGNFFGEFAAGAYYEKVHEYSNMEQRDIWEYTLRLSKDQQEMLIDHLWELSLNAQIPYLFLTENCSLVLLSAIQAAVPEKELLYGFNWYAEPLETVKRLQDAELIEEENFRPSLRTKLLHSYSKLSYGAQKQVRSSYSAKSMSSGIGADALDVILDRLSLERYRNLGVLSPHDRVFEESVLLRRSQLGEFEEYKVLKPSSPLQSHPTMSTKIGWGESRFEGESHPLVSLTWRPGAHDIIDPDIGYLSNSALRVFELSMKYNRQTSHIHLSNFEFLDFGVYTRYSELDFQPAWRLRARYTDVDFDVEYKRNMVQMMGDIGSLWSLKDGLEVSLLASADTRPWIEKGDGQLFLGPKALVIFRFFPFLKGIYSWSRGKDILSHSDIEMERHTFLAQYQPMRTHFFFGFEGSKNKSLADTHSKYILEVYSGMYF